MRAILGCLLVLAGCVGTPDLVGTISILNPRQVRVQGKMKRDSVILDLSGARIEVRGGQGTRADLRKNQKVEVYFYAPPTGRVPKHGRVRLLRVVE